MSGRTCILATHAVDLCLSGSAFVVLMSNGVITASGPPDTVKAALYDTLPLVDYAKNQSGLETPDLSEDALEHLKLVDDDSTNQEVSAPGVYGFYLQMLGGSCMIMGHAGWSFHNCGDTAF